MAKRKKLRDQRSPRHISVTDAAQLIAVARTMTGYTGDRSVPRLFRQAGEVAAAALTAWQDSPVALRVDSEFAGALFDSDTDVELVDECRAGSTLHHVAGTPDPAQAVDPDRSQWHTGRPCAFLVTATAFPKSGNRLASQAHLTWSDWSSQFLPPWSSAASSH